jgi:argonaute family protein
MANLADLQQTQVVLNQFLIKQLSEADRKVYEYTCNFTEFPEAGQEFKAIANVCYKLGEPAIHFGGKIITKTFVSSDKLKTDAWEVCLNEQKILDPTNDNERKALERLNLRSLELGLKRVWRDVTEVEKASEGGIIWWIKDKGIELSGDGWEVHRGRRIDIFIDASGKLFLEVDLHYKFYTPWTLHKWQDEYPDCKIDYVCNTYRDKDNHYKSWRYRSESGETPDSIKFSSGETLADYHKKIGATDAETSNSRVVYVVNANGYKNDQLTSHLSLRLRPSVTMEMLSHISEFSPNSEDKDNAFKVSGYIKRSIDTRLRESQLAVDSIANRIYAIEAFASEPVRMSAHILPKETLYGYKGKVSKTADVKSKGCIRAGELKFGCLNLVTKTEQYPQLVEDCLKDVANNSSAEIRLGKPRTSDKLPSSDLERQIFWQDWFKAGVQTILVLLSRSSIYSKQQIRVEALKAGIATQFMIPSPKDDQYKAMNVALGLLAKAGWQAVRLEPLDHPQAADLIIGFDTGTNRELYYGTSAFAVLADGQSLGWEIPDVQRGETFSGEAVWQTVSRLVLRFRELCKRYPKRILLMRDGLVQEGEFDRTIAKLKEENIEVDLIGVRKSGGGRMGKEDLQDDQIVYRDAYSGTVVFMPNEKSFLLVTTKTRGTGSVRPLRVIHVYGNAPLEVIALQTYHQTKLHPASGYSSARLPWVLHLADKSSKEFQRLGQMSILQNLNREKLIGV